MIYTKVLVLLIVCSLRSHATTVATHWMVTESGLIKPWFESPFAMNHPYDLLAFLNQDDRWESIINIYHDLSERQQLIDKLWAALHNNSNVAQHLSTNEDCVKSQSLKLVDWYTFYLPKGVSKKLSEEDFLFDLVDPPNSDHSTDVPDCKKISSLTFSMIAFEHLESVKNRNNLTLSPEFTLLELIPQMLTSKHLGHWASSALKQNSSSWLHYKMAALYWMIKGNGPKALECSRRAVHYVPREYKDIALLALGSVLHRCKATEDAIIVLNAAVDHNPNDHINHFILANAYAVHGNFNLSLTHYNKSLNITPDFELAKRHRSTVLCTKSLYIKMKHAKKALNILMKELIEYGKIETEWISSQATFLKTMKHKDEYDFTSVKRNYQKMSELTGHDMMKIKADGERNCLIQYVLEGHMHDQQWLDVKGVHILESAYNLQSLVKHIETHADLDSPLSGFQITDHILVRHRNMPSLLSDGVLEIPRMGEEGIQFPSVVQFDQKPKGDFFDYETGIVVYPPNMKINRNMEDFDLDMSWPSDLFCLEKTATFPAKLEALYPVFLPFENKGIRLRKLLTEKIGVSVTKEYELPWHPPNCPQDKEVNSLTPKKSNKQNLHIEVVILDNIRLHLLSYVGDGDWEAAAHMQDAEIGHRIYAAMKKSLVPKWITYTLASLYWRLRVNNINALHCLAAASKSVPNRYKDIVSASMASVYLELGYFEESLNAVEEAFRFGPYEPATNFILAELNMVKKHRNTHLFHLKQVVRVDSNFLGGAARNLLDAWMCSLKAVTDEADYAKEDICTPVEPGLNMVCEKEGVNCHMTNKKCMKHEAMSDSSLVEMIRLTESGQSKDGQSKDGQAVTPEQIFDTFLQKMPRHTTDIKGHRENYKAMMKKIEVAIKGCGPWGCDAPKTADLQEDDCSYQFLQLGYWIHMVSFKEMQADKDIRLPAELTNLPSSSKSIPECRLDIDPKLDFFLDKITTVDTSEWEPTLSVMQQFAEMFNFFDYGMLGTKIAKYIDMKPGSWVGALGAGWWCGAGGRAACAVRCLASAYSLAPTALAPHALRALVALLHLNSKPEDAREIAYLSLYASPKSKVDAYLVAVSHSYLEEYEKAVWMYRYSLHFDKDFLSSKACLHATLCLTVFKSAKDLPQRVD